MRQEYTPNGTTTLNFKYGTFRCFNFKHARKIPNAVSAEEILDWDHEGQGEAEFWPAGDNEKVSFLFRGKRSVTAFELRCLDRILTELRTDNEETYMKIAYLVQTRGSALEDITSANVEDLDPFIYKGESFRILRREAAYELFEFRHPDEYAIWAACECDGLIFDTERFLESRTLPVEEVNLDGQNHLLVVVVE